jgi:hypothetical protein
MNIGIVIVVIFICSCSSRVYVTLLRGTLHANGAHQNNNDNNTTAIFTRLNKATHTHKKKEHGRTAQEKIRTDVLKQMCFNMDENAII